MVSPDGTATFILATPIIGLKKPNLATHLLFIVWSESWVSCDVTGGLATYVCIQIKGPSKPSGSPFIGKEFKMLDKCTLSYYAKASRIPPVYKRCVIKMPSSFPPRPPWWDLPCIQTAYRQKGNSLLCRVQWKIGSHRVFWGSGLLLVSAFVQYYTVAYTHGIRNVHVCKFFSN